IGRVAVLAGLDDAVPAHAAVDARVAAAESGGDRQRGDRAWQHAQPRASRHSGFSLPNTGMMSSAPGSCACVRGCVVAAADFLLSASFSCWSLLGTTVLDCAIKPSARNVSTTLPSPRASCTSPGAVPTTLPATRTSVPSGTPLTVTITC